MTGKGEKGKRAELKKAKIIEDNLLFEEDEEEEEGREDEFSEFEQIS